MDGNELGERDREGPQEGQKEYVQTGYSQSPRKRRSRE